MSQTPSKFGLHQGHHTDPGQTALPLPLYPCGARLCWTTLKRNLASCLSLLPTLCIYEMFAIYFFKSSNTDKAKQFCRPLKSLSQCISIAKTKYQRQTNLHRQGLYEAQSWQQKVQPTWHWHLCEGALLHHIVEKTQKGRYPMQKEPKHEWLHLKQPMV